MIVVTEWSPAHKDSTGAHPLQAHFEADTASDDSVLYNSEEERLLAERLVLSGAFAELICRLIYQGVRR